MHTHRLEALGVVAFGVEALGVAWVMVVWMVAAAVARAEPALFVFHPHGRL